MYEVSLIVFVNAHIYVDVQVNAYSIWLYIMFEVELYVQT